MKDVRHVKLELEGEMTIVSHSGLKCFEMDLDDAEKVLQGLKAIQDKCSVGPLIERVELFTQRY